jgi:MFS family permease
MQSFRQYRRFERNARVDYERLKIRQRALEQGQIAGDISENSPEEEEPTQHRPSSIDSQTSNSEELSTHTLDSPDLEKAVPPPGFFVDGEGSNVPRDGGLERALTLTTIKTTQSFRTQMGHELIGIEVRQLSKELTKTRTRKSGRVPPAGDERETVFVVGYDCEQDDMNPRSWSNLIRISATILIAAIGFIVGFASSIDSAALTQAADEFGVSEVTESLATGLFLVGFGVGALFAGPISETVGRNPVYVVSLAVYMIWIMAAGLAPNIGSQLVFRFLAGFFGSTPLTCAGGSISDLWYPVERVYSFPVFANAAFFGPVMGPVVGGFIGQSSLVSWRWCEWITLIISGLVLAAVVLFQPETYAPILLKWKAAHLRQITGDERFVAEVEIRADPFRTRLLHALYRPFMLTAREPTVILFGLYLSVVYIILFTFLDGYAYVFGHTYGFSQGMTGLAFVGIGVGLCGSSFLVPLIHHWTKQDLKKLQETEGPNAQLPPEKRLYFAMLGAPAIPISLFWMGWTNYASVSYWSGLVASVFFGYGILCVFISTLQYIIDAYEVFAASALASLTLVRYVAAGGMVVVGIP